MVRVFGSASGRDPPLVPGRVPIAAALLKHLPRHQADHETVEAADRRAEAPTFTATGYDDRLDQAGNRAGRNVRAGDRQPPDETLEHRAQLAENGDVDEQMHDPVWTNVAVTRRHHSPLVVSGPNAGAPSEQRRRIAERRGGDSIQAATAT